MRSSSQQTNWRALSQKGQSLSLGDTICMQLKPARASPLPPLPCTCVATLTRCSLLPRAQRWGSRRGG